jgi:protein-S-isoprenylcysteine O-methyltransferase Ste14
MDEKIPISMNVLWITLLIFWVISGISAKKSALKEPLLQQFVFYWLPIILAVYLLGPDGRFGNSLVRGRFVDQTNIAGLTGLALSVLGLIIACWARYLLGNNWSVSVQKKDDHELISNGVYKLVRHPIYTGLLLMFLGNAVIVGSWRGLIAVLIVFISFWFKLKKEEKWLIEIFGNQYLEYMTKSKALIPWLI